MPLARSTPPPFLLPARGARILYRTLQTEASKTQYTADRDDGSQNTVRIRRRSSNKTHRILFKGVGKAVDNRDLSQSPNELMPSQCPAVHKPTTEVDGGYASPRRLNPASFAGQPGYSSIPRSNSGHPVKHTSPPFRSVASQWWPSKLHAQNRALLVNQLTLARSRTQKQRSQSTISNSDHDTSTGSAESRQNGLEYGKANPMSGDHSVRLHPAVATPAVLSLYANKKRFRAMRREAWCRNLIKRVASSRNGKEKELQRKADARRVAINVRGNNEASRPDDSSGAQQSTTSDPSSAVVLGGFRSVIPRDEKRRRAAGRLRPRDVQRGALDPIDTDAASSQDTPRGASGSVPIPCKGNEKTDPTWQNQSVAEVASMGVTQPLSSDNGISNSIPNTKRLLNGLWASLRKVRWDAMNSFKPMEKPKSLDNGFESFVDAKRDQTTTVKSHNMEITVPTGASNEIEKNFQARLKAKKSLLDVDYEKAKFYQTLAYRFLKNRTSLSELKELEHNGHKSFIDILPIIKIMPIGTKKRFLLVLRRRITVEAYQKLGMGRYADVLETMMSLLKTNTQANKMVQSSQREIALRSQVTTMGSFGKNIATATSIDEQSNSTDVHIVDIEQNVVKAVSRTENDVDGSTPPLMDQQNQRDTSVTELEQRLIAKIAELEAKLTRLTLLQGLATASTERPVPFSQADEMAEDLEMPFSKEEMFQEEAEEDDRVQRPTARNNLFEELFPEEQRLPASPPPRLKKVTIKPFEWNKGLVTPALYHRGDPFNSQEGLAMYPPVEREIPIADSTPGMHVVEEEMHRDGLQPVVVVLKGASPHLEESDFFRITPKGAHIEGWTSGIIKVVQSREATTLSSLSTYYILFTSEVAALAYMDQTRRLHNLARSNLGGIMIPSTAITASSIEYEATAAIRSFSLIPGQQKLEMQKLRHPYPEAAKHMIYNHGPKHLRDLRPNQEGLVVFGLQSGIATVRDIKEVLDKDGRTRNFLWDLVPENPIVELTSLRNGQTVRPPRRMVNGGWDNLKSKENHENYVVPSRFVLKFQKTDEARRFVREWHRRPFPQPSLYGDDEDAPVVEASYLW